LSGRRANTSSAAATKPSWSRPREREASRQTILDVARRLVELHGEAALTLSEVANEAGFARATVYGYFAGKDDLLMQLGDQATAVPEPPREAALISAAPKDDDPKPTACQPDAPIKTDAVRPQDEEALDAGGENARPSASEDFADYGDMMRLQAEQLDNLAKRIIVPKATTKEGTDGAISRLEARLRVVEQSLSDLQGRRSRDAKESADRIDLAIQNLEQRQKRLETSDDRQQVALAELRLELHNLPSQAKEAGLDVASGAAEYLEPTVSHEIDFQPWKKSPASETAEPNGASPESRQPDYLSSARRAAIDAAAVTMEESAGTGRLRFRWRWLFGAAIAVGVGLGIVFNLHSDVAVQPREVSRLVAHDNRRPPSRPAEKPSITALAKAGNAEAQLTLGLKLLNGAGVKMNIEKAASWLERAAEDGQPVAQETMGVLYQTGTGVAADLSRPWPISARSMPAARARERISSKRRSGLRAPRGSATSMLSSILPFCTSAARAFRAARPTPTNGMRMQRRAATAMPRRGPPSSGHSSFRYIYARQSRRRTASNPAPSTAPPTIFLPSPHWTQPTRPNNQRGRYAVVFGSGPNWFAPAVPGWMQK
jgi:TPR repeat protein